MRNADSASNLATLIDFSERTNTMKVPVFDPDQEAPKSPKPQSDFSGIKLNLDESR